jgi:hypothetical protein
VKEKKAPIHRLVLSVLLAGFCLLAGWVAAVHGVHAVPRDVPAMGEAIYRSPIAANGAYTMWLPIAFQERNMFANGDFNEGLRAWTAGRGPFNGRGSGLTQSVVLFNGDVRALLGQEGNLAPGTIPVGYGTLSQTWTADQRYVSLDYWVVSYDNAKTDRGYFDTFEVSINRPPADISNAERNDKGCDESARLNPGGTLFVSGAGLVFCGGHPGSSGGTRWDTGGWRTVTLDLSAFQGQNVTLYLTIWSREYDAPYYNDRAWFNTWAYVDHVQLRD